MTISLPEKIIKYFNDVSGSESGFYFYDKQSDGSYLRGKYLDPDVLDYDDNFNGQDTFEIDNSTAQDTSYNGQTIADTYIIRSSLNKHIIINDIVVGSYVNSEGVNVADLNKIVFDDDVTVIRAIQRINNGLAQVVVVIGEEGVSEKTITLIKGQTGSESPYLYTVKCEDYSEMQFIEKFGNNGFIPQSAPTIDDGTLYLPENTNGSQVAVKVGPIVASDVNHEDILKYKITDAVARDEYGVNHTHIKFNDLENKFSIITLDNTANIYYVGTGSEIDREFVKEIVLTIEVADDKGGKDTASVIIELVDQNDNTPSISPELIVNSLGTYDLTVDHLRYSDNDVVSVADSSIVFTISKNPETSPTGITFFRKGDSSQNISDERLEFEATFTLDDVKNGKIAVTITSGSYNDLYGLTLKVTDGVNPSVPVLFNSGVREVADIEAESGNGIDEANTVDYSGIAYDRKHLIIKTGYEADNITGSSGSDEITGGQGDDVIILDGDITDTDSEGRDIVIYHFGIWKSGTLTQTSAIDGGNAITGFKLGEDVLLLRTVSKDPQLDNLENFLQSAMGVKASAGDDLITVAPKWGGGNNDDGDYIHNITGIIITFNLSVNYDDGRLAQSTIDITFDKPLSLGDFTRLTNYPTSYNSSRNVIEGLTVLTDFMGKSLQYEVHSKPATAIDLVPEARTTIKDSVDVSEGIKIGEIIITDADGGSYGWLALAGNDASIFELRDGTNGRELWLKANTSLDKDVKNILNVSIHIKEDPTISKNVQISVTENHLPRATPEQLVTDRNTPITLTVDKLGYSDEDDDTIDTVIITSLPGRGALTFNNVAVTVNQSIPANRLSNLVYTPTIGQTVPQRDSFQFKVNDGDINSDVATMNIRVSAIAFTGANEAYEDNSKRDPEGLVVFDYTSIHNYILTFRDATDSTALDTTVGASNNQSIKLKYGWLTAKLDGSDGKWEYRLDNELDSVNGRNSGDEPLTESILFNYSRTGHSLARILDIIIHPSTDLDETDPTPIEQINITYTPSDTPPASLMLEGGSGDDVINGGEGADTIDGNGGNDWIDGKGGNDTLIINPHEGNDVVDGGAGTLDQLMFNTNEEGDNSNYKIEYDLNDESKWIYNASTQSWDPAPSNASESYTRIWIDKETFGTHDEGDEYHYLIRVEELSNFLGSNNDDVISGGHKTDNINGLGGNDTINGGGGNDSLEGGDGSDILDGGVGRDTYVSKHVNRTGNDIYTLNFNLRDANRYTSNGTLDSSGLYLRAVFHLPRNQIEYDYLTGIERLDIVAGGGNDVIKGNLYSDEISGGAGIDRLYGHGGDDILHGGDDGDMLYGNGGHDTLYGDGGDDTIFGADGNDIISGGSGVDTLYGGSHNDIMNGDSHKDKLYGGDGLDILYGDSGNDILRGGNNRDILYGGEGIDRLYGENGDDDLFGGLHDDKLYGGANNDLLVGGSGDDDLFGHAGNDTLHGGSGYNLTYGGPGDDFFIVNGKLPIGEDRGLQDVVDFSRGDVSGHVRYHNTVTSGGTDKIQVYIDSQSILFINRHVDLSGNSSIQALDKLKEAANIDWNQTINYNYADYDNDTVADPNNDSAIPDTVISTRGPSSVDLMVLHDFTELLNITHFQIIDVANAPDYL